MPLSIKDERAHALACKLAMATGESMTEAVRAVLEERLKRVEARRRGRRPVAARLNEIADHCASLPLVRERSVDEILGYDERGLTR